MEANLLQRNRRLIEKEPQIGEIRRPPLALAVPSLAAQLNHAGERWRRDSGRSGYAHGHQRDRVRIWHLEHSHRGGGHRRRGVKRRRYPLPMSDISLPLSPADAAAHLREDDWQILDVRLEHERAEGHIAGSFHIELTELSARAAEIEAERPVLVFCRSGTRSAMAVAALRGAGYDAHDLAGGMLAWAEAGLPVEPGA